MAPLLVTPRCSPIMLCSTVTMDSFSVDPPSERANLMERGVDCQPYVVVGLRQKLEENKKACRLHKIRLEVTFYPGSVHAHEVSYF